MKVVCINDSNRPKQIPEDKWIKKGVEYTLVKLVRLNIQANKLGASLEEITLDESCFPYEYFDADRFSPVFNSTISEEVEYSEPNFSEI